MRVTCPAHPSPPSPLIALNTSDEKRTKDYEGFVNEKQRTTEG